jgi:hypothetical protein
MRGDADDSAPASDLERAGSAGIWPLRIGDVCALALPRLTGASTGVAAFETDGVVSVGLDGVLGDTPPGASRTSNDISAGGSASNRSDLGRNVAPPFLAKADLPGASIAAEGNSTSVCAAGESRPTGGVTGESE